MKFSYIKYLLLLLHGIFGLPRYPLFLLWSIIGIDLYPHGYISELSRIDFDITTLAAHAPYPMHGVIPMRILSTIVLILLSLLR